MSNGFLIKGSYQLTILTFVVGLVAIAGLAAASAAVTDRVISASDDEPLAPDTEPADRDPDGPNSPSVAGDAATPSFDLPPTCGSDTLRACSFERGSLALVTQGTSIAAGEAGVSEISGDVVIPTAGGDLALADSDLVVEVGDDGEIVRLEGSADAPLPTSGPLAAAAVVDGARAEVGYAWGRDLTHLGAHLDPDRQYFFFQFTDSFSMRTGFDELFGEHAGLPVSLWVPGDRSVTMVLDPTDPYLYIGGACPDFGDDRDRDDDRASHDGSRDGSDDDSDRADEDPAELTVGGGDGEECGLGVSFGGRIPFQAEHDTGADGDLLGFAGHIVVHHGEIPLAAGVQLDGELVVQIADGSLAFGGNGELFASVPLVDEVVDLTVPFGDASTGVRMHRDGRDVGADLFISGELDASRAADELPTWLPIRPAVDATVTASARLTLGRHGHLVGPDSFVEIAGGMATTPSYLSELSGVTLEPLSAADGLARIDRSGIRLSGTVSTSVHPSVATGELTLDAFVSPVDPAASYFELVGTASIGETLLDGEARLHISGQGVEASGSVATPLTRVDLAGTITDDGVHLRGTARAEATIGSIGGMADVARERLGTARSAVDEIDAEIDRLRAEIIEWRRQVIADAQELVDEARVAFEQLDRTIAAARAELDRTKAELDRVIQDILDRFPLWEDITDFIESLIPTWLRDARDELRATIDRLTDDIDGWLEEHASAEALLRGAEQALAEIEQEHLDVAVDADPRILALLASRETLELGLGAAEGLVNLVDLDARVALEIEVQLGADGLRGEAVGQVCSGSECLDVLGGSVAFGPAPRACVTVAGIEGCVPF